MTDELNIPPGMLLYTPWWAVDDDGYAEEFRACTYSCRFRLPGRGLFSHGVDVTSGATDAEREIALSVLVKGVRKVAGEDAVEWLHPDTWEIL